jgi:polysaccharide biosynthesis transport protein
MFESMQGGRKPARSLLTLTKGVDSPIPSPVPPAQPSPPLQPEPVLTKEPTPSSPNVPLSREERQPPPPEDDRDRYWRPLIDPGQVVTGIARAKLLIVATTLIGAAVGIIIAVSTPKMYEAYTELLVDPRNLNIVDRDLTQAGLPSDATLAIVENQVRVLTSANVLSKVVDKLNLTSDPEFNGTAASLSLNPLSMLRSLMTRVDDPASREKNRRLLALRKLEKVLSVHRGEKTFVVVITASTDSAEKSALIANTVTQVFLQSYGKIQSDTAGRAADELTGRLGELRAGVEAAERKVEAYRSEHDLVDTQGRLITDDELVRLNDQLSVARARAIELNARAASARGLDVDAVIGGTLPEQVNSSLMTELRSQFATAQQELDRLNVRLGPRHPTRQAAEAQLAGARSQIQSELRRIVSSIQVELKRAVQLEQDLASRLAESKVRQGGVGSDLVTLRELEREASAKRAVYESYLLRARETGEQRDLNTANMSVISEAFPPLEPVGPSRALFVLGGAFLGFLSGVGIGGTSGAIRSFRQPLPVISRDPFEFDRRPPQDVPSPPERGPLPEKTRASPVLGHGGDNRAASDSASIDAIVAELRAFRGALQELTEKKSRQRF